MIWKIGILILCAIFLVSIAFIYLTVAYRPLQLLCIPYIVLLVVQRNDRDEEGNKLLTTETIVISVIAMVSLIIVAVVGIFAVFKNSRQLLLLVSTSICVIFVYFECLSSFCLILFFPVVCDYGCDVPVRHHPANSVLRECGYHRTEGQGLLGQGAIHLPHRHNHRHDRCGHWVRVWILAALACGPQEGKQW